MAVQVNVQANQQALINSIQQGVNAFNQRFAKSNTLNLNINEHLALPQLFWVQQ